MSDRTPSFILLVPGPWTSALAVQEDLARAGVEAQLWTEDLPESGAIRVDVVHEPQGFGAAMSRGRSGSLPSSVVAAASQTQHCALIEVARAFHDDPAATALLSAALRDAGGIAIRIESSGAASTWELWLDRLTGGDPMELVRAATILVDDEGTYFSCGMHAFDLPDAQIEHPDTIGASLWLETLCAYQVAEAPTLVSGHTFRADEAAPGRVLERWPDHHHPLEDGRHNPFGLWRGIEPDDDLISPADPVVVFMPALAALLMAAEEHCDRPLTQEQVESITKEATVVAMAPEQAIAMERSRGYADLEPQRVWAQWQLLARAR